MREVSEALEGGFTSGLNEQQMDELEEELAELMSSASWQDEQTREKSVKGDISSQSIPLPKPPPPTQIRASLSLENTEQNKPKSLPAI